MLSGWAVDKADGRTVRPSSCPETLARNLNGLRWAVHTEILPFIDFCGPSAFAVQGWPLDHQKYCQFMDNEMQDWGAKGRMELNE